MVIQEYDLIVKYCKASNILSLENRVADILSRYASVEKEEHMY